MRQLRDIPFPFSGLDKRRGLEMDVMDTTVHSVNVVPDDQISGRMRGGVRGGMSRRYPSNVAGNPSFLVVMESDEAKSNEHVRHLIAGSGSHLYRSRSNKIVTGDTTSYDDYLEPVTGNIGAGTNVVLGDAISVAVHTGSQIVLIADQGPPIIDGASGTMASGVLTISESTTDVNTTDHIAFIVSSSCPYVRTGAYKINSLGATTLTLDQTTIPAPASIGNGDVATYQVRKGNKFVDLKNGTSGLFEATTGTAPQGCSLVTIYRDRAVWVQDNLWYMSRQGDIYDYDYGADIDDYGRAIAGSLAEAGQAANPILALAPFGDDFLLMFGEDQTWVMRGDPAYGGQIDNLNRMVGCVDTNAWCYGPNGNVYFLSKEGVFAIGAGAQPGGSPVSNARLPRDLKDADRDNFNTTLVYDSQDNGIWIFVTPKDGTAGEHYFFDIDSTSFWKIQFANNDHQPVAAANYSSNPPTNRQVVVLSRDGFVRTIDGTDADDDTSTANIASELVIGPFRGGEQINFDGVLAQIMTTLGAGSGSVTIEIYKGVDAESAASAAIAGTSPSWTSTLGAGRNRSRYPRVRGSSFCIRLSSTDVWAFESLAVGLHPAGMQRI